MSTSFKSNTTVDFSEQLLTERASIIKLDNLDQDICICPTSPKISKNCYFF